MAWRKNAKLAALYRDLDKFNNKNKIVKMDKNKLIQLNMVSTRMYELLNQEVMAFKKQMAGSIYDKLKREMWEHSEILAQDKILNTVEKHLDIMLESKLKAIIEELTKNDNAFK